MQPPPKSPQPQRKNSRQIAPAEEEAVEAEEPVEAPAEEAAEEVALAELIGDPIRAAYSTTNGGALPAPMHRKTIKPYGLHKTQMNASGSDTWRCKECHGWDYMGVDGAYAGGSP